MLYKRDFKALAEIVKTIKPNRERARVAGLMSRYFHYENTSFSNAKWMEACEVE